MREMSRHACGYRDITRNFVITRRIVRGFSRASAYLTLLRGKAVLLVFRLEHMAPINTK